MSKGTIRKGTISVALCTFNGARYLTEQLKSLAAQTRLPDELVVCDDGSSDGTLEIIRWFEEAAPFRVRVYQNESNLGSTKNFEQAIGLCEGEFVALCDQDDIWLPEKLSSQYELMTSSPSLGGVFSDAELIDSKSDSLGPSLWKLLYCRLGSPEEFNRDRMLKVFLIDNVVTGATLMVRASVLDTIRPIPRTWIHDGWIAWMILLYSKLTFINSPLIRYRIHENQQVGIDRASFWRKFLELRTGPKRQLGARLQQFEELRDRWIDRPGLGHKEVLGAIEENIAFLQMRAAPFPGGLVRLRNILAGSKLYGKYAHGSRSFLNDVAFCLADCIGRRPRSSTS